MSKAAQNATFLSSLGAGLEYYDFIIYGMMAENLGPLFFAGQEPGVGLVKAFGVFAIGYLIRPFGGILFGMIGDTFGRKKSFLTVMFLMAGSTLSMGLLPTYGQIGPLAAYLLVFFRVLQGLSFGAELPGAITVVCEHSEKQKQGTYSGFLLSSVGFGSLLASGILYLLSTSLTQEQIQSWGWRIPFLLGGTLAIANYFIRKNLKETPEFQHLHATKPPVHLKDPLFRLMREYGKELIQGVGITLSVSSLVIFYLYLPTYLSSYFSYASQDIYFAMIGGMVWSILILPLCGRMADCFIKSKVLVTTCIIFAIGGFSLFSLLKGENLFSLIAFSILYQTVIAFLTVSYFPVLAALFPTALRYTGVAICYNFSYALMGCVPWLMTMVSKDSFPAILFLITNALLSAVSGILLINKSRQSLNAPTI